MSDPKKGKSMAARTVLGAVLIAALMALLWVDWRLGGQALRAPGLPLTVVVGLLMLAAFVELLRMLATKGVEVLWFSGSLGVVGIATLPTWWRWVAAHSGRTDGIDVLLVFGVLLLVIFFDEMVQRVVETALLRTAATALSVLYLGVGGAMILSIRLSYSMPVFVLFLTAVKCTDIGAYFVGSAFGRHKLVPRLSPNKSWEGLAGGLACGALASVALVWVASAWWPAWQMAITWPLWQTAVLAVAMGLAGQVGDLCESLLKRSAHVKDSGTVLLEFGGVLDMLDSLLLAAPAAMVLLAIVA